jgi:hypothetical protein
VAQSLLGPVSGNNLLMSPKPMPEKPEDVHSVWCSYCEIDHPLNVRLGV